MTRLAVIGLGKLGLSAAAYYAHRGARVTGIDVDSGVVGAVNAGTSPIGPEPGVDEHLADLVREGALWATTDYREGLAEAEAVVVLVPLLAPGGTPDFSTLDRATRDMAGALRPGALAVFETTLPVGTTRRRLAPVLRETEEGVLVAFSPERVSSGRIWRDLDTYPKLVGGVDEASTEAAAAFYRKYLGAEVWRLASAEAAELVKLAETTYRDLNIAFANELARFAEEWGVDVTEVIAAANSQPYSHIHAPGVGVGGHCIPHYPHLLQASTSGSGLVAEARRVNRAMPARVAERIEAEVGSLGGRRVLLLGVAYRAGVKEAADSPALDLARILDERGAVVEATDPLFSAAELEALGLAPAGDDPPDVVVLVTAHPEYLEMDWSRYPAALVVDGRNRLDRERVEGAGHTYLGVGR